MKTFLLLCVVAVSVCAQVPLTFDELGHSILVGGAGTVYWFARDWAPPGGDARVYDNMWQEKAFWSNSGDTWGWTSSDAGWTGQRLYLDTTLEDYWWEPGDLYFDNGGGEADEVNYYTGEYGGADPWEGEPEPEPGGSSSPFALVVYSEDSGIVYDTSGVSSAMAQGIMGAVLGGAILLAVFVGVRLIRALIVWFASPYRRGIGYLK